MQNLDKKRLFKPVSIAVLTVSDSRTLENDKSGDYLVNSVLKAGHTCDFREIVIDDVNEILKILNAWLDNNQLM